MSSHIEYRHLALAYPTAHVSARWEQVTGERRLSFNDTVYLVLAESGASNCTMFKRGADGREREVLERRWGIAAIGARWDVIAHACRIAPYAESGMTKLRNAGQSGWVSAEAYIRHYRTVLERAVDGLGSVPIAWNTIRFYDAEGAVKDCAWLQKAKANGRLTMRPRPYQAANEPLQFDTLLRLSASTGDGSESTDDGSLACDLLALASVFRMRTEYPHFYFENDISSKADAALNRAEYCRKHG